MILEKKKIDWATVTAVAGAVTAIATAVTAVATAVKTVREARQKKESEDSK